MRKLHRRELVEVGVARFHPEQLPAIGLGLLFQRDAVQLQLPRIRGQGACHQAQQGALAAPVAALHQGDARQDGDGQPGKKLDLGIGIVAKLRFSRQ
jgi:hypothetical protein